MLAIYLICHIEIFRIAAFCDNTLAICSDDALWDIIRARVQIDRNLKKFMCVSYVTSAIDVLYMYYTHMNFFSFCCLLDLANHRLDRASDISLTIKSGSYGLQ